MLHLENGDVMQLENGEVLRLEDDNAGPVDPVTSDPGYWRGPSWIGHEHVNWPTDGALR